MNMKPKVFVVALVLAFGFFAVQVRSDESPSDHETAAGLAAIEPPVEVARPVPPHRTVTLTPAGAASVATDGTLGGAVKFQFAPSRGRSYILASEGDRLPLSEDIQATVLLGPAGGRREFYVVQERRRSEPGRDGRHENRLFGFAFEGGRNDRPTLRIGADGEVSVTLRHAAEDPQADLRFVGTEAPPLPPPIDRTGANEPVHRGRTLTSWLGDLDYGRFPDRAKVDAAERAVLAIGPDALPVLVERLDPTTPYAERLLERIAALERQGKSEEASNLAGSDMIDDIATVEAFRLLEGQGRPAVPALIRLLPLLRDAAQGEGPATEFAGRKAAGAAEALANVGRAAVPLLIEALRSEDVRMRFGAAEAFQSVGGGPEAAGALVAALRDPDESVRLRAAQTLGSLGAAPKDCVPALTALVRVDASTSVRLYALQALGKYGHAARAAVPVVAAATEDPNPAVRQRAAETLEKIRAAGAADPAGPNGPVVPVHREGM